MYEAMIFIAGFIAGIALMIALMVIAANTTRSYRSEQDRGPESGRSNPEHPAKSPDVRQTKPRWTLILNADWGHSRSRTRRVPSLRCARSP
jgi:hypothetical protein